MIYLAQFECVLSSSIDIQTLTTQQDSDQGSHLHSQHQDTDAVLLLNIAGLMAHLCLIWNCKLQKSLANSEAVVEVDLPECLGTPVGNLE